MQHIYLKLLFFFYRFYFMNEIYEKKKFCFPYDKNYSTEYLYLSNILYNNEMQHRHTHTHTIKQSKRFIYIQYNIGDNDFTEYIYITTI